MRFYCIFFKQEEYCNLLAEKIDKIQTELEAKRQRRRQEQQTAGSLGSPATGMTELEEPQPQMSPGMVSEILHLTGAMLYIFASKTKFIQMYGKK